MNGAQASRGGAMLIALGVQGLILLMLVIGFGITPPPRLDLPTMAVALLPTQRRSPDPPASLPDVHLHQLDPGRVPVVVPVEITLPAPAEAQPAPAPVPRTTDQDAAGTTSGTDTMIGIRRRVEPEYPQAAVEHRAQGTTAVAILVDADGHPGEVRILTSSGDTRLDAAAVRAVRKWEFTPATSNAKVVPKWGRLEVNFNLTQYRQQHPRGAERASQAEDPVAALFALVRSWSDIPGRRSRDAQNERGRELLTPALSALLQRDGAVRAIRLLGVVERPSDAALQGDPQALRMLDAGALAGWDLFEVTQARSTSHWYCAVDAAGQIQQILPESN